MSEEEKKDPYELDQDEDDSAEPGGQDDDASQEESAEPVPLSEENTLDVCPNCGAGMPGDDEVVCLRCGFDLQRSQQQQTVINQQGQRDEAEDDDHQPAEPLPFSPPGLGGVIAPTIVAAICGAIMITAYLAGWQGLFATQEGLFRDAEGQYLLDAPSWSSRIAGAARYVPYRGLLALGGFTALVGLARTSERPVGNDMIALMRMVAVVTAISLITLIDLGSFNLERMIELIGQAGGFILLCMAFYRLQPKPAAMLGLVTIVAIVGLILLSKIIGWIAPF